MAKSQRKRAGQIKNRALNAFDIAVDDEQYIKGLRQQQDIDLDNFADDRIRELLNGEVASDDDEEIDSDEAIGSASDIEIDLNEEESDWGNSFDEEELLDLSQVWDQDDKENGTANKVEPVSTELDDQSASESESKSESDGESDSDSDSDSANESELGFSDMESWGSEDEENDALRDAVKKISGTHGKVGQRLDTQAGPENPFLMPSGREKLSLDELTGTVKADLKLVKPKLTPKTLSVPLPQRIQSRADRGAAYELAKDEVTKWEDTVKSNRRAEHLSFPINAPPQHEMPSVFVQSESKNTLEETVQGLLTASSLADERAASAFEETAGSNLSFEELKQRRQELRYKRELMFREEQRAKRIKKIKSKSYRRVHKKERERERALLEAAGELSEEDEEEQMRKRALERASLKHKTTSKWAKRMIEHGMSKDADTRAEMEEMLRQGESMRQKVVGGGSDDSDSGDDGDMADVFELNEQQEPRKGVMAMKFMVDAENKQREANRRLLEGENGDDTEVTNIGRRSYDPVAAADAEKTAAAMADSDDDVPRGKISHKRKQIGDEEVVIRRETAAAPESVDTAPAQNSTDNPWLAISAHKASAKFTPVTKDSSREDRAAHKLKKAKRAGGNGRDEDEDVEIDVANTLGGMVREGQMTLEQQDLVRRAFAGDDVAAEFMAEKSEAVEADGDQEIDETLPGWGSWGGDGLAPKVRRIRQVKGVDEKKRKDYRKQDVIINEKINKKNSRYTASAVPFPFENRAQYERSLQMPLGKEWQTKDTFQRQTKPRILVKRGEVIDPIKAKNHS